MCEACKVDFVTLMNLTSQGVFELRSHSATLHMWRPRPVAAELNATLGTVKLHLLCARRQIVGVYDEDRCGLHAAINELLFL